MPTLVKDFMKQPVATMALPANIAEVRDLMKQKSCHAIPLVVVGEEKQISVKGIVTADDLVGVYDDTVSIRQVMTKKVHAVSPDSNARSAASLMLDQQVHHLLVMEGDKILGIISSMDFVELIARDGA